VAIGASGDVYVGDLMNQRVDVFSATGAFQRAFGKNVNSADFSDTCTTTCQAGTAGAGAGQLSSPQGIAIGASGDVYVADSATARISQFTAAGAFVRAFGKSVNSDDSSDICTTACKAGSQTGAAGALSMPTGVAVDASSGDVYVAEFSGARISQFTAAGAFVRAFGKNVNSDDSSDICTTACKAAAGGPAAGQLDNPLMVAVSASGDVYVSDSHNQRISHYSSTGTFVGAFGKNVNSDDNSDVCTTACKAGTAGGAAGQLNNPAGVAVSASGDVYVSDSANQRMAVFSSTGTFLRAFGKIVNGIDGSDTCTTTCLPGNAGSAAGQFNTPNGVAVNASGSVYISDLANQRIQKWATQQSTSTVTLTSPANGSSTNDTTPALSGVASTAIGDSATVTVKVYFGTGTGGRLLQTRTATRDPSTGAYSVDATTLPEGRYTAQAQQSDSADNPATSSANTFTIQTSPPTLVAPANGSSTNDTTPALSGIARTTGSATVTVHVYAGAGTGGTLLQTRPTTRDPSTGAYSVDATTLSDGTYTAQAEQFDAGGNNEASSANTFTIDTSGPTVSLVAPANGSSTNDTTPALSGVGGTATGDSATVTVKVYAGTGTGGTLLQTRTTTRDPSTGAYSVDATTLSAGTYTAQAEQSDGVGNPGTSTANSFTLDTTNPSVSLTAPADGSSTNDTTPALSGVGGTATGDSATVTVKVYDGTGTGGTLLQTRPATRNPSTGAYSVDATTLPDGTYTAQAEQSDAASNSGTSSANTFTIDTSGPTVSLLAPADGSSTNDTTPALSGVASTGDSATVTVNVYAGTSADGAPLQTRPATRDDSTGAYSVDATTLPDGTYTAQAEQSDAVSNKGTSTANTFTVDTAAPDTSIVSGPSGTTNATSATFEFGSNESGAAFECKLDGAADWTRCQTTYDGLADQQHTLEVRAIDKAENVDASPASRTWTVDSSSDTQSVSGDAPSDGTVETGTDPTPSDPVTTAVTTPTAGPVTISEQPVTQSPPSGYGILGQEIVISAPTASVNDPLKLVFTIDATLIPAGVDASNMTMLRNGVAVPDCTAANSTIAAPNPCISKRETVAGDVRLTVLTSAASKWNFVTIPASDGGGDGGGGGGGGGTTGGDGTGGTGATGGLPGVTPDLTPPIAKLSFARKQRLGSLKVAVTSSEAGLVGVTGKLTISTPRKTYSVKAISRTVAAKTETTLRLRLSKKATRAAKRALRRGRKVTVKVTVVAIDLFGNRRTLDAIAIRVRR
jgi:5-hydroxyisourate hydrolase-like protein (transthyretin family)